MSALYIGLQRWLRETEERRRQRGRVRRALRLRLGRGCALRRPAGPLWFRLLRLACRRDTQR